MTQASFRHTTSSESISPSRFRHPCCPTSHGLSRCSRLTLQQGLQLIPLPQQNLIRPAVRWSVRSHCHGWATGKICREGRFQEATLASAQGWLLAGSTLESVSKKSDLSS
ncbi:protein of unknown function (plasmid) [Caballeronia sp. S22]